MVLNADIWNHIIHMPTNFQLVSLPNLFAFKNSFCLLDSICLYLTSFQKTNIVYQNFWTGREGAKYEAFKTFYMTV